MYILLRQNQAPQVSRKDSGGARAKVGEAPEGARNTSNSKLHQTNKSFASFYHNIHSAADFTGSLKSLCRTSWKILTAKLPKGKVSKGFWSGPGARMDGRNEEGVLTKAGGYSPEKESEAGNQHRAFKLLVMTPTARWILVVSINSALPP